MGVDQSIELLPSCTLSLRLLSVPRRASCPLQIAKGGTVKRQSGVLIERCYWGRIYPNVCKVKYAFLCLTPQILQKSHSQRQNNHTFVQWWVRELSITARELVIKIAASSLFQRVALAYLGAILRGLGNVWTFLRRGCDMPDRHGRTVIKFH